MLDRLWPGALTRAVAERGRRNSRFNYETREKREWGGESSRKSRVWLPFSIRDIRFIRSAGCSVLLPADPCSSVKSVVVLGPKRRKGPDFGLSTTNHANDTNGEKGKKFSVCSPADSGHA